jgi:glycosyltransferase involved in cell wall biosynthesis
MKIGIHLGSTNPTSGGEFTFQLEMCKALFQVAPESNHELILFHGTNLSAFFHENTIKNLQPVLLHAPLLKRVYYKLYRIVRRGVNFFLSSFINVDRLMKTPTIDVKYIQESNVDMMWYVGPFCSTMDIPYIFTVLDLQHRIQPYFPEISNDGVWEAREKVYSHELRRASFVIVSTNVGKAEIEKFYQIPGERISVLPYAAPQLDHDQINDDVLQKYGLQSGYLFYPAQFWPEKNHIGLLKAVRLLRDKWNISLEVVLVGSDRGNLTYVQEWIIRLGLSEQVHILGFIPREDLMALYKYALALTMPTLVGPDNLPSLEAFALNCPVITSNISGFKEQLGEAALLVDPTNEEQLALAIKSVYEDPELKQKLISSGLEKISKWSWVDYVRGQLKILDHFQPIRRAWGSSLNNMR